MGGCGLGCLTGSTGLGLGCWTGLGLGTGSTGLGLGCLTGSTGLGIGCLTGSTGLGLGCLTGSTGLGLGCLTGSTGLGLGCLTGSTGLGLGCLTGLGLGCWTGLGLGTGSTGLGLGCLTGSTGLGLGCLTGSTGLGLVGLTGSTGLGLGCCSGLGGLTGSISLGLGFTTGSTGFEIAGLTGSTGFGLNCWKGLGLCCLFGATERGGGGFITEEEGFGDAVMDVTGGVGATGCGETLLTGDTDGGWEGLLGVEVEADTAVPTCFDGNDLPKVVLASEGVEPFEDVLALGCGDTLLALTWDSGWEGLLGTGEVVTAGFVEVSTCFGGVDLPKVRLGSGGTLPL